VVTGIFGMNIFGFSEIPVPLQVMWLLGTIVAVTMLLFYTLSKSKALADFLDSVSDERLSNSAKVQALINVWRKKRR
jgi:hypothetical protein